MTERTRSEIEEEVEELALEIMKWDSGLTIEAARSTVYEEIPDLYAEYKAAPAEVPVQTIEKAEREQTLGQVIHGAVKKQAATLAWTEWPTKTIEQLEWNVWESDEGRLLYDLYRSEDGRKPISEVEHRIRKSAGNGAWSILRKWRAG